VLTAVPLQGVPAGHGEPLIGPTRPSGRSGPNARGSSQSPVPAPRSSTASRRRSSRTSLATRSC
jgi:hypothetical protein